MRPIERFDHAQPPLVSGALYASNTILHLVFFLQQFDREGLDCLKLINSILLNFLLRLPIFMLTEACHIVNIRIEYTPSVTFRGSGSYYAPPVSERKQGFFRGLIWRILSFSSMESM